MPSVTLSLSEKRCSDDARCNGQQEVHAARCVHTPLANAQCVQLGWMGGNPNPNHASLAACWSHDRLACAFYLPPNHRSPSCSIALSSHDVTTACVAVICTCHILRGRSSRPLDVAVERRISVHSTRGRVPAAIRDRPSRPLLASRYTRAHAPPHHHGPRGLNLGRFSSRGVATLCPAFP